ncbi:hypothetical protein [Lysobacter sp. FW306-1B-D06B]|uniref:hypothetical protein n=1 Tax=Lysobacter sp. FW306-1B-D06B TaxID=3140250 RepID=UPI00314010F7
MTLASGGGTGSVRQPAVLFARHEFFQAGSIKPLGLPQGWGQDMLSTDELNNGYWGSRRIAGVLPETSITHPDQFTGGDALILACTQTHLPASEQRKLVKAWCALLPQLQLKTLIFSTKVNQELFDAATQIKGLHALSIKWSSIKSIASITDTDSLAALDIGSSPSMTGLGHLAKLPRLRSLRVENVKEAHDLAFVESLTDLEEFGASGSMWTDLKIDSLWPLKDMHNLELLWLVGAKVLKDGLLPLHGLPRLTTLHCAYNFRASEFAALRAATPSLRFGSPFEHELIEKYCRD